MDTPFDPTLEDDIKQVLAEVPPPIRAYFASGKVETVAKDLMKKNQLHIDQGAIVEREIILLLLGLKDPTEFTQALAQEAQLDQQTVNGIVQDVNDQIFVPLREEMQKRGDITQPAKPPEVAKPALSSVAPVVTMPPPAPPRPMNDLPRSITMPPSSQFGGGTLITANPQMPSHALHSFISSVAPTSTASLEPALPQSAPPNESQTSIPPPLLPLGEETPMRSVNLIARPPAPPPPNLPGAMPSIATPNIQQPTPNNIPRPPIQPPSPPSPVPATSPPPMPPLKPYTIDPYHEPIDEK